MSIAAGIQTHRESAGILIVDMVEATSIPADVFLRVERGEAEPVAVDAYLRALLLVGESKGFQDYRWAAETRRWLDRLEAAR